MYLLLNLAVKHVFLFRTAALYNNDSCDKQRLKNRQTSRSNMSGTVLVSVMAASHMIQ